MIAGFPGPNSKNDKSTLLFRWRREVPSRKAQIRKIWVCATSPDPVFKEKPDAGAYLQYGAGWRNPFRHGVA